VPKRMTMPSVHVSSHAVCVTGLERSFTEIGDNVRHAILRFLGTPAITFLGVQPVNDSWSTIHKLLPMHAIEPQFPCTGEAEFNFTASWLHCDMKSRRTDCCRSFLQMLCDLQHCEAMIREVELVQGHPFATITRLRPDLFWEVAIRAPSPVKNGTVYVPALDRQAGVNDHLAHGGR
jgi:hypothetical protein